MTCTRCGLEPATCPTNTLCGKCFGYPLNQVKPRALKVGDVCTEPERLRAGMRVREERHPWEGRLLDHVEDPDPRWCKWKTDDGLAVYCQNVSDHGVTILSLPEEERPAAFSPAEHATKGQIIFGGPAQVSFYNAQPALPALATRIDEPAKGSVIREEDIAPLVQKPAPPPARCAPALIINCTRSCSPAKPCRTTASCPVFAEKTAAIGTERENRRYTVMQYHERQEAARMRRDCETFTPSGYGGLMGRYRGTR